jgi:hypothetical protein
MPSIKLPKKVLFLEFYVTSVEFVGRDMAKDFAPDTLHYIGPAKATETRFLDNETRKWVSQNEHPLGFLNGKPVMTKNMSGKWSVDANTRWISLVGGEYYEASEKQWLRSVDQVVQVHTKEKPHVAYRPKLKQIPALMPYEFWVKSIGKHDVVTVEYPREKTTLEVGKTYAYICYRQQYQVEGMSYTFPNTYVVLYVKNHGLHDEIDIVSAKEFKALDTSNLTREKPVIRDFRKHSRKFSF